MTLRHLAKRRTSQVLRLRDLARREARAIGAVDMPLHRRVALWRRGFTSESGALYDLSGGRHALYLNDLAHALHTPLINGTSNPTLNDKVLFFHTMRSLGVPTPAVFALVGDGRTSWFDDAGVGRDVVALLRREGELVLKPSDGGRGHGIHFLAHEDGRLLVDGAPGDEEAVRALLVPGTLVCERVHQSAWSAAIFPGAVNTIRAITMWDDEHQEPFVALAAHRFGTSRSAPVDNLSQGGLMAGIDVRTGELAEAMSTPYASRAARYDRHPDTEAQIRGAVVPRWEAVRDELLGVATRMAHIPYVGWDVLIGDEGFWIIEGNNHSDTIFQVFAPLLADGRVRRFYARHGVVRERGDRQRLRLGRREHALG